MWPQPFRIPELKKSLPKKGMPLPDSAEWLLYQMSSVGESDLPVGSFSKELLESWEATDIKTQELKSNLFDDQGQP